MIHDNQSLCYELLYFQKKIPLITTIHHPISKDLKYELKGGADDKIELEFETGFQLTPKKNCKTQFESEISDINSLKDRMMRSMTVVFNKESENVERNLTFLATAGSTAPFIGLFGTVWGIMNSFKSIAIAQNTNLAVVAPGIAEALFATALGLFVAIPAVVAYNKISNDLSKYFISLETFMDEFSTIFFRQLEKK